MSSLFEIKKLKRGRESDLHLLLKKAAAIELQNRGMDIHLEESTRENHRVDVLGVNGNRKSVVECETLFEEQDRLASSFRKALLSFGPFDAILCIPKFADFREIWLVDNSGKVMPYRAGES